MDAVGKMLASMLGVDPEELKKQAVEFATNLRKRVESIDERLKRIEEKQALIMALQDRILTVIEAPMASAERVGPEAQEFVRVYVPETGEKISHINGSDSNA